MCSYQYGAAHLQILVGRFHAVFLQTHTDTQGDTRNLLEVMFITLIVGCMHGVMISWMHDYI